MPVLADITFGQTLLIIFEAFLLVIWVWVLILIILDLFRDDDLSGWAKAGWVLLVLVLGVIGGVIYLIVRGNGMRRRQVAHHLELQQAAGVSAGPSPSAADELEKLDRLRERGVLSAEEFAAAKGKVLT